MNQGISQQFEVALDNESPQRRFGFLVLKAVHGTTYASRLETEDLISGWIFFVGDWCGLKRVRVRGVKGKPYFPHPRLFLLIRDNSRNMFNGLSRRLLSTDA